MRVFVFFTFAFCMHLLYNIVCMFLEVIIRSMSIILFMEASCTPKLNSNHGLINDPSIIFVHQSSQCMDCPLRKRFVVYKLSYKIIPRALRAHKGLFIVNIPTSYIRMR